MFLAGVIKQTQTMLQGYPILSDEEINAGLVFPTVAQTLLGTSGTYLMLVLILLAVMSTGSGQVCVHGTVHNVMYVYAGHSHCLYHYLRHLPAIHSAFQERYKGKSLLTL